MKVLHICTVDEGGAALCCLRLHQSLLKQGVESKVLFKKKSANIPGVYQYKETFNEFLIRLVSRVLRFLGIQVTERNKVYYLSKKYKKAYTLPVSSCDVSKNKLVKWADVIHLHWIDDFVNQPSFFKKVNKPIIWTLHDEGLFYGIAHHHKNILLDNPLEIKYRYIKQQAVMRAHNINIVFLSNMMFQNFGKEKFIEGHKKIVINNSVDPEIYHPMNQLEVRKKYGLKPDKKYFVFISMNIADSNKGLDLLSEVLMEINVGIEILAIGGNPWKRQWPNVVEMGLVANQQQMCELISCANYLGMPSYQEAFPQSPMEAMACGLPVVAFPVSGTKELINEDNGIICNDFTKDSLKTGILKLLSKQYEAEKIRRDMIDRFSPEMIARKYINLYNESIEHY